MIESDYAPHCHLCRRPRAEIRLMLTRSHLDPIKRETFISACCDECALTLFASLTFGPLATVVDCRRDRIRGGFNACPTCHAYEGEGCRPNCETHRKAIDPMGPL